MKHITQHLRTHAHTHAQLQSQKKMQVGCAHRYALTHAMHQQQRSIVCIVASQHLRSVCISSGLLTWRMIGDCNVAIVCMHVCMWLRCSDSMYSCIHVHNACAFYFVICMLVWSGTIKHPHHTTQILIHIYHYGTFCTFACRALWRCYCHLLVQRTHETH